MPKLRSGEEWAKSLRQEIKGKGDDEIRSMAAQDFDALVPVMVEMGMGEQGKRKRSITYMGTKELAA